MRGGKTKWIMRIAGGRENYEGDGMRGMRKESEGKTLEVGVGAQEKKGEGWRGMVRMREVGGEYSIMIRCRSSPDQLVRRLSKHAQYPGPSSLTGVLGRHMPPGQEMPKQPCRHTVSGDR